MKNIFNKLISAFLISFAVLSASCSFDSGVSSKVEYTVSYYQQNIEDDEYTLFETETLTGKTGDDAEIPVKTYEGFTVQAFEQQKISSGLDVAVKYDRNTITCTLNFNGGTVTAEDGTVSEAASVSGRYGAEMVLPEPVRTGYIVETWYDLSGNEISSTFTVSGTYSASWISKSSSTYSVHHYFQNVENDGYTENTELTKTLNGLTGTKTSAAAETVEGFTAKSVEQKKIASDGSTSVSIYYDRNLVTLIFDLAGGSGDTSVTGKYGATVNVVSPEKTGAEFSAWSPDLPVTFRENASFTAVYDMPYYTVKYLFENLSDSDYSEDSSYPAKTYLGKAGQITAVSAADVKGFSSQTIEQKTVSADNSTVVYVKYNRRTITLFVDLKNGVGTNYVTGKYCSESEITESHAQVVTALANLAVSADAPVKVGYILNGFKYDESLAFTLENDNTTPIYAEWTGGKAAKYQVLICKENADFENEDDRYEVVESLYTDGISGELTDAAADFSDNSISFAGETRSYPNYVPADITNIEINGNDQSVLKLCFNRKTVSITYKLNGGNVDGDNANVVFTGRFGSAFSGFDKTVVRKGYSFVEWNEDYSVFPEEDRTVVARWKANSYKIIFIDSVDTTVSQEIEYDYGTEYAMPGSDTITFTNEGKGISGWKLPDANGNYDADAEVAYKPTEAFILPESITETLTMKLYAVWGGKYYTVNHYQHKVSTTSSDYKTTADSSYELKNTDVIYTDDSTTSAAAKNYEGFYVNTDDRAFSQTDIAEDNSTVINIYYERNLVTITFVPNGGTVNCSKFFGDEIDSTNNTAKGRYGSVLAWNSTELITHDGYELIWKDANPNGTIVEYRYRYPANDTVYEAEWKIINYTITYNNLNGTDNSSAVTGYTINDSFELKRPQNISGYSFAGWYSDSALTAQVSSVEAGTTGNLTFYAKWVPTGSLFTTTIVDVGDIVYSDGTYIHPVDGIDSSYLENNKKDKVVGIVVYNRGSDDNPDWRYVGMNNGSGRWSNEENQLTELSRDAISDGYDSNAVFETYESSTNYTNAVFDCFDYVKNYGTTCGLSGVYASDWYVPSYSELGNIKNNLTKINTSRKILGCGDLPENIWSCNIGDYYKSATACYYNNGYGSPWCYNGIDRDYFTCAYLPMHKAK